MRKISALFALAWLLEATTFNLIYGQSISGIVPDTANREYRKLMNCINRSEYFLTRNKDSSIYYLQLCEEMSKKTELTVAPELLFEIARQYHRNNEYRKALEFFTFASARAEKNNDAGMLVHSRNWAGYIHSQLGESENAIELLLNNLNYARKNSVDSCISETNMMLGFAYRDSRDNTNAMKYFTAAKESAESTGSDENMSAILGEIGNLHAVAGNIKEGLEYQFKALEMRTKVNDSTMMGYSYNDIANSYYLNKDYNRAIRYFEESLLLHKHMNNEWASFYSYINLASVFSDIREFGLQKAYLDSAKTMADDLQMKPVYQLYHESCLQYYENLSDYKEVYNQYRLLNAYRDSL